MVTTASSHRMVAQNIRRFADEVRKRPGLADRLAAFRAWYAVQDKHGVWNFGPSKFVGYADLDGKTYISLTNAGKLDGRVTEERLQAFFRPVDEDTTLYEEMYAALGEFLAEFDKIPCKSIRINISDDAYEDHFVNDGNAAPVIDLIVAVARGLPSSQVKELTRRLRKISG